MGIFTNTLPQVPSSDGVTDVFHLCLSVWNCSVLESAYVALSPLHYFFLMSAGNLVVHTHTAWYLRCFCILDMVSLPLCRTVTQFNLILSLASAQQYVSCQCMFVEWMSEWRKCERVMGITDRWQHFFFLNSKAQSPWSCPLELISWVYKCQHVEQWE